VFELDLSMTVTASQQHRLGVGVGSRDQGVTLLQGQITYFMISQLSQTTFHLI